jgi:ethanolamine utilization microcompartment shell protein EutS
MLVFISANNAEFNKSLSDSSKSTKSFQANVLDLNKTLSAFGIGIGIYEAAKALKNAANVAIEFEKTMSEVRAITGASGREFEALEQDALRLGAATKFSATEVGQLQVAYGRLGFTTKEILAATEATLDLAAATGEDLAKSADVAGSTVRGFGLSANQTQRVVDVMASSFNKTALGLDNFAESMKYVAPDAAAAGASVEETTALLGTLADAGIRGSQAGTSLRKIFSELTRDGRPLADRIAELSKKGLTLADAYDEVGRTAQTSLLILTKNEAKSRELAAAFENVAGEAAKMARAMSDNAAGDIDKLSSAWEGMILKFSNTSWMRRVLQEFTQFISSLSGAADMDILLNDLVRQIQGGQTAAINGIIELLTNLRSEAGKPIDIAIASELAQKYNLTDKQAEQLYNSILNINQALSFQEKAIKQFNDFASRNGYQDISKAADDYKQKLYELIIAQQIQKDDLLELQKIDNSPAIGASVRRTDDQIKAYRRVIDIINEYVEASQSAAGAGTDVAVSTAETLQSLENQLQNLRGLQKNTPTSDIKTLQSLEKQIEAVQTKIDKVIQKILGLDQVSVEMLIDIKSPTLDKITGINTGAAALGIELPKLTMPPVDGSYFADSLRSLQNNVRGFVSETKDLIVLDFGPSVNSALNSIGEAIGTALSGSENFGRSLLKVLGGLLTQLGQMLISVGVGLLALKKSMATLNPALVIGAGVALVALGAYVSSSIKSMGTNPSGTSGGGTASRSSDAITGSLTAREFEITLAGEFRIQGPDLVYILNRQAQLDKRTKG